MLMKLNKKIATNATAYFSALLVTGICYSAQVDKEAISTRCERVCSELDKIFAEQMSATCTRDVQHVGWVIHEAAVLVRSERYPTALKNLRMADGYLSGIFFTDVCTYFSAKVKPALDEVKILINELEYISN